MMMMTMMIVVTLLTGGMYSTPTLTHVLPCKGFRVNAVEIHGDDVFVVRPHSQEIKVYDAVSFALLRKITVPGIGSSLTGLAACARNHCLYAADIWRDKIHRVDLSVKSSNAVDTWSEVPRPSGLSVNRSDNVVVACWAENKLQEYTTHGTLVREICLQTNPLHATQLSSGDYVVTASGKVSVVGVNGQVLQRYGKSPTTGTAQIKNPSSLAVTKNDSILVTDVSNNRILSLNNSLSSVQELALSMVV